MLIKASGAATAVGSGMTLYFGYTESEWSVIGIMAGIAIGVLGLVGQLGLTWYFKMQDLKLAREHHKAGAWDG